METRHKFYICVAISILAYVYLVTKLNMFDGAVLVISITMAYASSIYSLKEIKEIIENEEK